MQHPVVLRDDLHKRSDVLVWYDTRRQDGVDRCSPRRPVMLDAFVVMPNHVHGLIGLRPTDGNDCADGGDPDVETLHATSLRASSRAPSPTDPAMSSISPAAGSLPVIVRSYKSAVTRAMRRAGTFDFAWQSRFYDHIVRDEQALHATRRYINENPGRWSEDSLYTSA